MRNRPTYVHVVLDGAGQRPRKTKEYLSSPRRMLTTSMSYWYSLVLAPGLLTLDDSPINLPSTLDGEHLKNSLAFKFRQCFDQSRWRIPLSG